MPPVAVVVKVHRTVGLSEDQGAGDQQRWIRVGVIGGVRGLLGKCHVSGGLHEPTELRHRHRMLVHPEPVDRNPMRGGFLRVEVVGSHEERPT